jgi:hypothetical protein
MLPGRAGAPLKRITLGVLGGAYDLALCYILATVDPDTEAVKQFETRLHRII